MFSDVFTVSVQPPTQNVEEGDDAIVMVVLSSPADFEVTVMVSSQDGSAAGGMLLTAVSRKGGSILFSMSLIDACDLCHMLQFCSLIGACDIIHQCC